MKPLSTSDRARERTLTTWGYHAHGMCVHTCIPVRLNFLHQTARKGQKSTRPCSSSSPLTAGRWRTGKSGRELGQEGRGARGRRQDDTHASSSLPLDSMHAPHCPLRHRHRRRLSLPSSSRACLSSSCTSSLMLTTRSSLRPRPYALRPTSRVCGLGFRPRP